MWAALSLTMRLWKVLLQSGVVDFKYSKKYIHTRGWKMMNWLNCIMGMVFKPYCYTSEEILLRMMNEWNYERWCLGNVRWKGEKSDYFFLCRNLHFMGFYGLACIEMNLGQIFFWLWGDYWWRQVIFWTVCQTGRAWALILCVKGPIDPAGFWGLVLQAKGLYQDQNIIPNDVQSGLVVGS